MSEPEQGGRRRRRRTRDDDDEDVVTRRRRFMIEKALWNCCVSLVLTEILPGLYLGGYVVHSSSLSFFLSHIRPQRETRNQ